MKLPQLNDGEMRQSCTAQSRGVPALHSAGAGVEQSYSGACCRRDPASGKFLDCCYGQCRVVSSC
jgi:hypothetical protein